MSHDRKCEVCGFAFYAVNRKPMEVCFVHGFEKWLCFSCYMKWAATREAASNAA